jgi:hypothetical protein
MARTKQTARKSTAGKPKSGGERVREHRERKKARLLESVTDVEVLFIISNSHLQKVDVLPNQIPLSNQLLRNHCIFALNHVHTANSVDQHMNITYATPQETIQNILDNHPTTDDIAHDPYHALFVMGVGGIFEMPDANQAVALSFRDGFLAAQPVGVNPLNPIVYCVKRETLMYYIDHPTDPSKKDVAFQFIKNNFDHVHLRNDDDLCVPVPSLGAGNPQQTKWHCLLEFLGSVRIAGNKSIYPPLSMVHFLENKYQQKQMLGIKTRKGVNTFMLPSILTETPNGLDSEFVPKVTSNINTSGNNSNSVLSSSRHQATPSSIFCPTQSVSERDANVSPSASFSLLVDKL